MKNLLFIIVLLFIPSSFIYSNQINEMDDKFKSLQAQVWKKEVELLIENKKWHELESIENIGTTHFSDEKIWDEDFKSLWQKYEIQKSINSWDKSKSKKSVWKLSSNTNPSYSMGISVQDNTPIVMFVNLNDTWNCFDRCNITITNTTDRESFFLSARPSLSSNQKKVNMLGSPLPLNRIKNTYQEWEVVFPDGKSARFDTSFLPLACQYHLNSCK